MAENEQAGEANEADAEAGTEAESEADGSAAGVAENTEPPKKSKIPGKVIVLFIGAPLLVLIIAVVVLLFLMGGGEKEEDYAEEYYHEEDEQESNKKYADKEEDGEDPYEKPKRRVKALKAEEAIYIDMPDLLVNLNTGNSSVTYLKLKIALEVHVDTDVEALNKGIPKVIDTFQIYLRQMRVDDLSGSAGLFRLKEELLRRVNTSLYPIHIYNVLFKEMIIQ